MARLLKLQSATGAQVVAVGDPKQCQAIEAGPVIDLMRRALGAEAGAGAAFDGAPAERRGNAKPA